MAPRSAQARLSSLRRARAASPASRKPKRRSHGLAGRFEFGSPAKTVMSETLAPDRTLSLIVAPSE